MDGMSMAGGNVQPWHDMNDEILSGSWRDPDNGLL